MSLDNVGPVRSILFWALLLALIGTGAELTLLEHVNGFAQLIPIFLVMAALLTLSWFGFSSSRGPIRTFRLLMVLFVAAGILGTGLHFRGNVKRELEDQPALEGRELFRIGLTGKSPALAPGVMIQIGLVGFAFTWRHPALTK